MGVLNEARIQVIEAVATTALILGFLVFVGLPLTGWIERRARSATAGMRDESASDARWIDHASGVFQSWVDAEPRSELARPVLTPFGEAVCLWLPLVAFAWIPFAAGTSLRDVALPGAHPVSAFGLLSVLLIGFLASLAPLVAGFAAQTPGSLVRLVRGAVQCVAFQLPLWLSAFSIALVFGSLDLQQLAWAQDVAVPMWPLFEPTFGSTLPAYANAMVPAWGVFVQPFAFGIFGLSMIGTLPTAFGARRGLLAIAECARVLLGAALLVQLFFGSWSVPGFPTEEIVGTFAPVIGAGFAGVLCIALQAALCTAKWIFAVWFLLALRRALPQLDSEAWTLFAWTRLAPLAFFNLLATAYVIVWWDAL